MKSQPTLGQVEQQHIPHLSPTHIFKFLQKWPKNIMT